MTPRRKQAISYVIASVPMIWWGASQFEIGGHDKLMAIALAISLTFGMLFAVCGIVMLFTKHKLGVMEPMQEDTQLRVAKSGVTVSLARDAIKPEPEQTTMLVDEHVWSAKMVKEYRSLGDTVKDCTAKRADIKAILTGRGIDINEDGNIEIK